MGAAVPTAYVADVAPSGMNAAAMSAFRMLEDLGYVVGPIALGVASAGVWTWEIHEGLEIDSHAIRVAAALPNRTTAGALVEHVTGGAAVRRLIHRGVHERCGTLGCPFPSRRNQRPPSLYGTKKCSIRETPMDPLSSNKIVGCLPSADLEFIEEEITILPSSDRQKSSCGGGHANMTMINHSNHAKRVLSGPNRLETVHESSTQEVLLVYSHEKR